MRIIEKEQQYKEVRTQVESMRVTYEKHQRELNERLERSVQENSAMSVLYVPWEGLWKRFVFSRLVPRTQRSTA